LPKVGVARLRYGKRIEILGVAAGEGGIDLAALMRLLAERGWSKVLLEGGSHLAASALKAGIVDRVAFFIAPKILGGGFPAIEGLPAITMRAALPVTNLTARPSGADWLLEADIPTLRV
jgi:diaminohydroxyphosphoribosylaminopyrimidine deaminase/5-amino-6-(5-phosphoribosylamino)uracil reductase